MLFADHKRTKAHTGEASKRSNDDLLYTFIMNKHKLSQYGFIHFQIIVILLLVVAVVGFAIYRITTTSEVNNSNATVRDTEVVKAFNFADCLKQNAKPGEDPSKANDICITKQLEQSKKSPEPADDAPDDSKPMLKGVGFNIDYYNSSTNRAGDMKFGTGDFPSDQILGIFGVQDPRSPNDPSRRNPQPHIVLPENTAVLSMMDGVVIDVKELYSGDYSIMIGNSEKSTYIAETEHVKDPSVKKGDRVVANQPIAVSSTFDSQSFPGFSLVEIGILHPTAGGEASHLCPYEFLDSSVKSEITSKVASILKGWETYRGKNVYDEANYAIPGCANTEPVNG